MRGNTGRLKKVLIIARYYGTRVPGLIKNLPDFGWRPVFLTTALPRENRIADDITVLQTRGRVESHFAVAPGRSVFSRVLSLGGEVINYPDSYKSWKNPA